MNRASDTLDTPVSADRVMLSLLSAAHALEEHLERALAPAGLSMSKLGVLSHLVESDDPLPLSTLAQRLACVRSNITQLVDRLEADGLVKRVDDPADRRAVLAVITALGRERQRLGQRALEQVQQEFLAALPPADLAAVARGLAVLR